MGKRLIIKGADFSGVAVSNEPILNPLEIIGCGQGASWIGGESAPDGSYWLLTNNGNLYEKINGAGTVVDMPAGYNSLIIGDVILNKPSGTTRYDVAYPDDLEVVELTAGKKYVYNASQNTEPQQESGGGINCAHVSLHAGDVLVYNGTGGEGARAIWVMKSDFSETIKVTDANAFATYAPIVYVATSDCEVYINSTDTNTNYVYRK